MKGAQTLSENTSLLWGRGRKVSSDTEGVTSREDDLVKHERWDLARSEAGNLWTVVDNVGFWAAGSVCLGRWQSQR